MRALEWEDVPGELTISRAKVPGGWLVRELTNVAHFGAFNHEHITTGYDWRVCMTFVPDPSHSW